MNDSVGQALPLPGTALAAMNLHGPRAALDHSDRVVVDGRIVRVALLGAFLFAKAAAFTGRGHDKDLYDFAYVLVEAERTTPGRAATAVLAALPAAVDYDPAAVVRAACAAFASSGRGTAIYAAEMALAGSMDDLDTLELDAAIAVRGFLRDLAAADARFSE